MLVLYTSIPFRGSLNRVLVGIIYRPRIRRLQQTDGELLPRRQVADGGSLCINERGGGLYDTNPHEDEAVRSCKGGQNVICSIIMLPGRI